MTFVYLNRFFFWYPHLILDTDIHKEPAPITNKLSILGSFDEEGYNNNDKNKEDVQADGGGGNDQILADAATALRKAARRSDKNSKAQNDTHASDDSQSPELNETSFQNITINPKLRPVLRTNLFTFTLSGDSSGEYMVADIRLCINNFTKSSELFSIYGPDQVGGKFSLTMLILIQALSA